MESNNTNVTNSNRTLFDRIVIDDERPDELNLKDVAWLMVATLETSKTTWPAGNQKAEILLRDLIKRGVLPVTENGQQCASRSTRLVHGYGVMGEFPPWADSRTGMEALYTIRRADLALLVDHLEGWGEGFKKWISIEPLQKEKSDGLWTNQDTPLVDNQSVDEPPMKTGSNPRKNVDAWVKYQAPKLVIKDDTIKSLANRILALAEHRRYESERGPLKLASCIKMIPAETTGGRQKNGRKNNHV